MNEKVSTPFAWERLGQHILNYLNGAAERRDLAALDLRQLEDCGLTPADVSVGLPDLYAYDFRVNRAA